MKAGETKAAVGAANYPRDTLHSLTLFSIISAIYQSPSLNSACLYLYISRRCLTTVAEHANATGSVHISMSVAHLQLEAPVCISIPRKTNPPTVTYYVLTLL